MGKEGFFNRIKNESLSFLEEIGKANELLYLLLLTLYVSIYFILKIAWVSQAEQIIKSLQLAILSIVMWGSGIYLFFIIAAWKKLWNKTIPLVLMGIVILGVVFIFTHKMSTNVYGVVMDLFFCLMAYKKDFRKMVRCILLVTVVMLLIAGIGLAAGFTMDMGKPDTLTPGHSIGIDYPNTWGYLVFLGMITSWYLYLRYKPLRTFLLFLPICAFMYCYITCRTISIIGIVFPVLALFVDRIEKRNDQKAEDGTLKKRKFLEYFVIAMPFLAWAFMMINSMAYEWWHHFYYGPLRNLAWRFIQGGLYFKTYGLPLIGNPYRGNQYNYVNVNGAFIPVGILDSSFAAYIIMRGILWLTYTLLWLCVAYWKALKKRDYAIILLETVLLAFAMMERPGLEMWYNFILLYPLARVFSKPRTERALEFDKVSNVIGSTNLTDIAVYEKEYKSFMQIGEFPPYRLEEYEIENISNHVLCSDIKSVDVEENAEDGGRISTFGASDSIGITENMGSTEVSEKNNAFGKNGVDMNLARTGFDFSCKTHCLRLPSEQNVSKEDIYTAFTQILDTEKFVKGNEERYTCSQGFREYHAAQVLFKCFLGDEKYNDSRPFSMTNVIREDSTADDYVREKYKRAAVAFSDTRSASAEGDLLNSLLALYHFLGVKSVCEMYAVDFDRSKYDMTVFADKLSPAVFNKIDNHMHGNVNEFIFNVSLKDFKEAMLALQLSND